MYQAPFHNYVDMEILNSLAVAGGCFNRLVDVYEPNFDKEIMQKSLESGALVHWSAEQKGYLLQFVIKRGYTDLKREMLDQRLLRFPVKIFTELLLFSISIALISSFSSLGRTFCVSSTMAAGGGGSCLRVSRTFVTRSAIPS